MTKVCLFILGCMMYQLSLGQTGSIEGKIYDPNEVDAFVGANVVINGTTKETIADTSGNFKLSNLSVGVYELHISRIGFPPGYFSNIEVKENTTTQVELEWPPPCKFYKTRDSKICPICKRKNKVTRHIYYCIPDPCHPRWHCKRDNLDF